MAAPSNLSNLLDSLPESENFLESLQDIKTILFAIHPSTLKDVVPNVSFDAIFDCLSSEDSEQVSVCCDVVDRLLTAVDATVLLHQFHQRLLQGLQHPSQAVTLLTLNQILRAANGSSQQVAQYPEVLAMLIQIIAGENLHHGQIASQILVQLATSSDGISEMFNGATYQQLLSVMEQSDVIRYRVYEMLISMVSSCPDALSSCSHLLQRLSNEVDGDDILLQLNCLELLGRLADCNHGYDFLVTNGTITRLERRLHEMQADPMAALLMPGLLKVFGHIGYRQPKEVCGSLEPVLHQLFDCVTSPDLGLRAVAIETVGHIGSTPEGKLALSKQGNRMTATCQSICRTCVDAPTEVRVKALDAVTDLVHLQVSEQTAELQDIVQHWFHSLCPRPGVSALQKMAHQQPFPELRLAGLRILRELARQPWGQSLLLAEPGFFEYLLDRSTETEREGKQAKFDVIEMLVQSPTSMNVIGREKMIKFRAYHMEGPFFVKVESAVAYEGE